MTEYWTCLVLFWQKKSHKCLIAKFSRSTELFHELFAHLKEFFVTVPVALEEFAGDLETETKEEVDNQELAKGNGMHKINHSRRNIICISDSTIYISNRVTKKVNYGAKHLPFSSAVSPSLLGQTRIQGWLCAVCSRVGHTLGARCEHLYNARARGKVFCRRTENKL